MLPTYALPFVIVVVGAENMSALVSMPLLCASNEQTRAVFSVPFNHSVPDRIGMGLSKVGTTIALTSLTDLALLGLCWLCVHLTPVREFCVFAAVVIVADWFMLHTFFLTVGDFASRLTLQVLSIDAQRLELADVLASNGGLSNHEAERREEESRQRRLNNSTRFNWRAALRARAAKSGSLLLLVTSVALLYYYTERGRSTFNTAAALYGYIPTVTSSAASGPTLATSASELAALSPSQAFWMALNPRGLSAVRVNLPPSCIAIFPRVGHSMLPEDIRKLSMPVRKFKMPTLGPIWSVVKFFIVPQVLSALALYLLLRFLLKDSELLDAQRNRLGRGREANGSDDESDDGGIPLRTSTKTSFAAGFGVYMLPASHESDVDVLVSSANGKLAMSVAVDNSVCLWRFTSNDQCSGTREMVSTQLPGGDPIVGGAVSRDCQFIAVATRKGTVQLWSTPDDGKTESLGTVDLCAAARVVSLLFDDCNQGGDDPFTSSPVSVGRPERSDYAPSLVVALADGSVLAVKHASRVVDLIPPAERESTNSCRVDMFQTDNGLEVVVCADAITRWKQTHGEWHSVVLNTTHDPSDRVLCATRATVSWYDRPNSLVALGRRSGFVEVFDEEGEPAGMGQTGDAVRKIAMANTPTTQCTTCDSHSSDGFFLISSTSSHVFIDRVAPRGSVFCRCAPTRRASTLTLDETVTGVFSPVVIPPSPARGRYRSNGQLSVTASPMKASLAPPTNGDFPVSSHGGRRLSGWREDPRPPSPLDRSSSFTALTSLVMSSTEDTPNPISTDSQWEDVEVIPLGGVRATDGGWEVLDSAVVGVRRNIAGIDDSQWQLWAVDLTSPWNGSSLLVDVASLDALERKTRATSPHTLRPAASESELPMRARRAERILSMTGRASFPSSLGSFSVPTHQPLGYVAVRPFCAAGRAALAGFGNRVGVFRQPLSRTPAPINPTPTIAITTPQRAFHSPPPPTPPPKRQAPSLAKV